MKKSRKIIVKIIGCDEETRGKLANWEVKPRVRSLDDLSRNKELEKEIRNGLSRVG